MLKTKPLTQLLSQSISPNVSSALLFTPSGSLLATGTSPIAPDAKRARTNAALAANIWAAYDRAANTLAPTSSSPTSEHDDEDDSLNSLTLELSEYNMHIALVTPRVLLCLIGPKTPRHTSSRSSAHSQDHELRITPPGSAPRSRNGGSTAPASVRNVASPAPGGSLGILKTQAAALVSYLEKELKGYELPPGL